ncbi:ABC transporter ATP-binding protein [Sedimentitalea sp. XS_ASV28]|uniref:ABC transporter ATP-binding protein n=1 Tax=Sedimentitalea sp. XS_ASV28 TaxID=3241296 RepID=UPI0035145BEC
MTPIPPLLSLRDVTKRYGSFVANEGVCLDIAPASIHAILGENGAGKSTLMKTIYGVHDFDEGTIKWQGKTVTLRNPAQARALGIGMVFQHFCLFETLSVVENISMTVPGKLSDLADRVRRFGAEYDLVVNPFAPVHSLSIGERQRVEIIRCLMQDLKLLILDEPTSVLPPQHVPALFDALRKLQGKGVSILYISHKLEEICALCDAATVLRNGRTVADVDPRAVSSEELARLMVGSDIATINRVKVRAGTTGEALRLCDVSRRDADPFVCDLSGINLTVNHGEIVGIAGISGNGQKELARIISGEDLADGLDADAITMLGTAVGTQPVRKRRKLGFAFVPEERLGRGAVPGLSLWSNALLTTYDHGMLSNGYVRRNRLLEFSRACIDDLKVKCAGPEALAGSLSGGNLQKFILAREIRQNPKLLFVAQPTWGVDVGAAAQIRQRLLDLRAQGAGILVISEELEELFEICDRLHAINHGTLSPAYHVDEVTPRDIGEMMIGRAFAGGDNAVSS